MRFGEACEHYVVGIADFANGAVGAEFLGTPARFGPACKFWGQVLQRLPLRIGVTVFIFIVVHDIEQDQDLDPEKDQNLDPEKDQDLDLDLDKDQDLDPEKDQDPDQDLDKDQYIDQMYLLYFVFLNIIIYQDQEQDPDQELMYLLYFDLFSIE